ncbi:MAG: GNAT family N-acetyltransferase [Thermoplasmata archaeon]
MPSDRERVIEFLRHISPDSLELRFFSALRPEAVTNEILGGGRSPDRLSLILETTDAFPGQILGHGECARSPEDPARAEVAFLVADDHQGLGIATLLLWRLAERARTVGIRYLDARVMKENRSMIDVFAGAGFPCTISWEAEEADVSLDIARCPQTALLVRPAAPGAVTAIT